ncbi:HTH_48 domain-containing protein [Trichonephila clavipes]|nr:HTH_48 domain-containing protein [Trichonephila clavipes]
MSDSAIKFCFRLEHNATATFAKLQQAYGDSVLSRAQVFRWFKAFSEGRESIEDEPRGGRPSVSKTAETETKGLPLVAAVAEWYRYRTVACFVTGSSPVSLKTRRVGQRCTLNLSRAETSSRWCGVVVRRGVPAQVSSTSLDHGSKLRGPSPKALV